MKITWDLTPRTSLLHALWAAGADRPLADPRLGKTVIHAAKALHSALLEATITPDPFWEQALPLGGQVSQTLDLLSAALEACGIPQGTRAAVVPKLARLLDDAEAQVGGAWPSLAEELTLRHRPLREQWETRGPGLWGWLCRQFPGVGGPSACRVLAVLPAVGGGGWLHRPHQALRMECVLANPHGELPEVVRLAWLVAQAACDWPTELDRGHDLHRLTALALLPATLAAADELELVACPGALVAGALSVWMPAAAGALAESLCAWWQQVAHGPYPWPQALVALDHVLAACGCLGAPRPAAAAETAISPAAAAERRRSP